MHQCSREQLLLNSLMSKKKTMIQLLNIVLGILYSIVLRKYNEYWMFMIISLVSAKILHTSLLWNNVVQYIEIENMLPIDKLVKNDINPCFLLSKILWEAWDLCEIILRNCCTIKILSHVIMLYYDNFT